MYPLITMAALLTSGLSPAGPAGAATPPVPAPATARPSVVTTAQDHSPVAATYTTKIVTSSMGHYAVHAGDSLSKIAAREYGSPGAWPALWWVNRHQIRNPNVIYTGHRFYLSKWHPQTAWLLHTAEAHIPKPPPPPPPAPVAPPAPQTSTNTQSAAPAPVTPAAPAPQAAPQQVNPGSYSGFQQCVISRESGGNSQVMNSSGHYGLYQFSESTWEAYGGSAADFGHASVAEQNQVFNSAMSSPSGAQNWSPYDGCTP